MAQKIKQLICFSSKGIVPLSVGPVYTATKAGVIAFTRCFKVRIRVLFVIAARFTVGRIWPYVVTVKSVFTKDFHCACLRTEISYFNNFIGLSQMTRVRTGLEDS